MEKNDGFTQFMKETIDGQIWTNRRIHITFLFVKWYWHESESEILFI